MREIKFLVYLNTQEGVKRYSVDRIDYKRYGDFGIARIYYGDYYVIGDALKDGFAHLVQYTGLKDKNGREIYEGDIVQFKHEQSDVWEVSEVVYFGDGEWQYPAFDLNAGKLKSHFEAHVLQIIVCSGEYDYKVCGNIYENPELLGDKQ